MQQSHTHMRLTVVLLMILSPMMMLPAIAVGQQLNCIDLAVQDAEVLAHKRFDVNQDGTPDDVVIYGHDELYVLVVANQPASNCKVILNDRLTSRQIFRGERWPVTVTQVELTDLTGDNRPELHIGLEGTYFFRQSGAFHAIYMLQDQAMERIFVSDQCLPMSSFEIRVAPDGTKVIYRDEDRRCDPPSIRRDYGLYQWDTEAARFKLIESGEIDKWAPNTFMDLVYGACIASPLVVVTTLLIGAIVWMRRKRQLAKAIKD